MKVAFFTLGCKVNQVETAAMEQLLTAAGHTVTPWESAADAYVVNTCAVTATSGQKSRRMIRQTAREHPRAVIAVCGCLPQVEAAPLLDIEEVDLLFGSGRREEFVATLLAAVAGKRAVRAVAAVPETFEHLPPGAPEGRTRAFLKMQDGCDNRCTYCVIPDARGHARSLPEKAVRDDAASLAAQGFRELVLTGIEISSWGRDLPGSPSLCALIEAVCRQNPGLRIRLGSLEPNTVTPEFAALLALPNLCPHVHLSLQSGCDDTLARMGRRYDTAFFAARLALLRAACPGVAVTTDLIVGFPGETDDDFDKTLAFARACVFAGMHIFPYSRRPGTPAAAFPNQLPAAVKKERAARAGVLAAELSALRRRTLVGTTADVLFETGGTGHAADYTEVWVKNGEALSGRRLPVLLTGLSKDGMTGEAIV